MYFKTSYILLLIAVTISCLCHEAQTAYVKPRRSRMTALFQTSDNETKMQTSTDAAIASKAKDVKADDDDDNDEDDDADEVDADAADTSEKNALQAGNDTSELSIWSTVRGLWSWLSESLFESESEVVGRTFGKIRRLQMALIPIVFKFGILTAMVAFLVMLGIKTIFMLKLLMLMNAVGLLAKFLTLKSSYEHQMAPSWGHANWAQYAPPQHGGWSTGPAEPQHPSKEIHLHIHGAKVPSLQGGAPHAVYGVGAQPGWERRNDAYAAYEPTTAQSQTELDNELNNTGGLPYLPVKYASNHRQLRHVLH